MPGQGNRLNLFVGLLLNAVVTLPTLALLSTELDRRAFAPDNRWLLLALVSLLVCGLVLSAIGLMRRLHWGFFAWSQGTLSFLVLLLYLGWTRRETEYARLGPDPDALDKSPPTATWEGLLFIVALWLVVAFLPLAIKMLGRWRRQRKPGSRQTQVMKPIH